MICRRTFVRNIFAAAAIAPFAILGAVVGLIVRLIAERRLESPADAAPTPTH